MVSVFNLLAPSSNWWARVWVDRIQELGDKRLLVNIGMDPAIKGTLLWGQVSATVLDSDYHPVMLLLPLDNQSAPLEQGADRFRFFRLVSKRNIDDFDIPFFLRISALLEIGENRREHKKQAPVSIELLQKVTQFFDFKGQRPPRNSWKSEIVEHAATSQDMLNALVTKIIANPIGILFSDPPTNDVTTPEANHSFTGPSLVTGGSTDGTHVIVRYTCPPGDGTVVISRPIYPNMFGLWTHTVNVPCLGWGSLCITTYNSSGESTTVCLPVNRVS